MKHTQLKYDYIKPVDSWENPIAKEGFYDESEIAQFTGCWDDQDNYYEVLFYKDDTFCIDENGNEVNLPDTDNWQDQDTTYIYFDDESGKYFEQSTNGNHWYEITEPVLMKPF